MNYFNTHNNLSSVLSMWVKVSTGYIKITIITIFDWINTYIIAGSYICYLDTCAKYMSGTIINNLN